MSTPYRFEIAFERESDDQPGYRAVLRAVMPDWAEVAEGSVGQQEVSSALEACQPLLLRDSNEPLDRKALLRAGRQLHSVLLPSGIERSLAETVFRLDIGKSHLPDIRVDLFLPSDALELEELPFEFAYCTNGDLGSEFWALHPRLRLVRRTTRTAQGIPSARHGAGSAVAVSTVLVAWADVKNAEYGSLPHLKDEFGYVTDAWGHCAESLANCLKSSLRMRLQEEPPPNIIHIATHGAMGASGGFVVLNGDLPGSSERLYVDDLTHWIAGLSSELQLVVLSACSSAAPGAMAQRLCEAGVPAVIGMRLPYGDFPGSSFARALHLALADGNPVDTAVWKARKEIREHSGDFGSPVLYLSVDDAPVFAKTRVVTETPGKPRVNKTIPFPKSLTFVGREETIDQINEQFWENDPRPVAIIGMTGSGKTQLAVQYGHTGFDKRQFNYVYLMQARDRQQLIDGLAQLGSVAFGFSDTQTPHMSAQLVKSNLEKVDEPVLIILDDMGKSVDLALLPVGRNSRILATSQFYGDWQDHFVTIAIQELSENDAFEIISRNNPPCDSSEESSARAIVGFLGRLPVALTLVSQHILRLGVTYSDYLGQLQERPFNRLDSARNNWVKATNHDGNIYDAIVAVYRSLEGQSRLLLEIFCCFGMYPIAAVALAQVSGMDQDSHADAQFDLVRCSLLGGPDDQKRYRTHELVRLAVREAIRSNNTVYIGHLSQVCAYLTRAFQEANQALSWRDVRLLVVHAVSVAVDCVKEHLYGDYVGLSVQMAAYHIEQFEWTHARFWIDRGSAAAARELGQNHIDTIRLLIRRAELAYFEDHFSKSYDMAVRATDLAIDSGAATSRDLGDCYNTRGVCLRGMERYELALENFDKAIELYRTDENVEVSKTAECLINVGAVFEKLHDFDQAIKYCDYAINMLKSSARPNQVTQGLAIFNRARIVRAKGAASAKSGDVDGASKNYEQALRDYVDALSRLEEVHGKDHPDVYRSHFRIGELLSDLGRVEEAREHIRIAKPLAETFYPHDKGRLARINEVIARLGGLDNEKTM